MKLSTTNLVFLEQQSAKYGVTPEILVDAIIRMMRERDESKEQSLEDWIAAAGNARIESMIQLEQKQKLRVMTEEAAYAVRFYVQRITELAP